MTAGKIMFYTHPGSRGRVVRWMLEEIGQPYEAKILEFGAQMKAPEYLAINPMGKVPAIQHGNALVTEVVAICAYLADVFPQAGLTPDANDHKARGDYYRWLFFVAGPFEAAITDKFLEIEIPKEKQGSVGYGNYDQVVKVLEEVLKDKEYIAGNRFTAADLVLSAYLSFHMYTGSIPAKPVFEAYVGRHISRPASVRANEIDQALLEKKAS